MSEIPEMYGVTFTTWNGLTVVERNAFTALILYFGADHWMIGAYGILLGNNIQISPVDVPINPSDWTTAYQQFI